jgi:hypothetical protein
VCTDSDSYDPIEYEVTHQEDQISFWVYNGEQFLTHGIAEPFSESKIAKPAMWITQSGVFLTSSSIRTEKVDADPYKQINICAGHPLRVPSTTSDHSGWRRRASGAPCNVDPYYYIIVVDRSPDF